MEFKITLCEWQIVCEIFNNIINKFDYPIFSAV